MQRCAEVIPFRESHRYVLAEGLCPQQPISNYPLFQTVPAVGQESRLCTTYYICRLIKRRGKALVGLKNSQSIYPVFCLQYWQVQVLLD